MKNKTHTHKALEGVLTDIEEIRKDVTSGERVFADMQLDHLTRTVRSIQREQLPMDVDDAKAEGLSYAYNDAADNLNNLSARIYDICSPGECNTTP
jgi:hypothetical protein